MRVFIWVIIQSSLKCKLNRNKYNQLGYESGDGFDIDQIRSIDIRSDEK